MNRAYLKTEKGNPQNEDRGVIIDAAVGLVLAVADGAGGRSGGAEAAAMAVEIIRESAHQLVDPSACANVLHEADKRIAADRIAGETTCALVVITRAEVYGASVGDSGVLAVSATALLNLTEGQARKPFLGSGSAWARPFFHTLQYPTTIVTATDGLLKYTSVEKIAEVCRDNPALIAAAKLVDLVRYASGALPDDVTVIVSAPENV